MAFVKLTNLYGKTIKIPAGAAKSYKNLGFYPEGEVEQNAAPTGEITIDEAEEEAEEIKEADEEVSAKEENDDDESFVEKILKKPLSQWSKNEVKRYAGIYNIDLAGTKSANEAKERIKAFMDDAE